MDKETTKILSQTNFNKNTNNFCKYLLYGIFMICIFNLGFIIINNGINNKNCLNYWKEINYQLNQLEYLLKKNYQSKNISFNEHDMAKNEEFNEYTKKYYEQLQTNFCLNSSNFNNLEIENMIEKVLISYDNHTFNIFIYKENDIISESIHNNGVWNADVSHNFLSSLNFFSIKKNLSKDNVYFIDIGANIGWYSYFLGNSGYQVLSFEPSKFNNYVLKKNYCLNKDVKIIIINKSVNIQNKNCFLGHKISNIGESILICNKKLNLYKNNYFIEEISMTKLSNYISFLSNKNIALMSLNLDGSEEKAIIGGQALIIKYHIPFIYMKFIPKLLENQSTNIKLFLEFFEINGYKFSLIDFLSKEYISIDELLKRNGVNLYIIYSNFFE